MAIVALYLIVMPHPDRSLVVICSLTGIFLLYCGFALRRYFPRAYRKDQRYKHDFNADISDVGVHIVTHSSERTIKWDAFIRFLQSETIFMLFVAEWSFLILPKRAFSNDEADQFRSLLQTHIPCSK